MSLIALGESFGKINTADVLIRMKTLYGSVIASECGRIPVKFELDKVSAIA